MEIIRKGYDQRQYIGSLEAKEPMTESHLRALDFDQGLLAFFELERKVCVKTAQTKAVSAARKLQTVSQLLGHAGLVRFSERVSGWHEFDGARKTVHSDRLCVRIAAISTARS